MWTWLESQQSAFNMAKDLISRAPVLSYYDPLKGLTLENDTCKYGLGAALVQEEQPVAYASCSLSDTEKRYAQIEKEMLAVVYGLEQFHHYTHGRKVNVFTDHKPLISIFQKPLVKAPKRLQNLLLRAQQYDFSIKYKPGNEIPFANALSRAPTDKPGAEERMIVNNLTMHPIKDRRLLEIRSKTLEDPTTKILTEVIATSWPSDKRLLPDSLKPFFNYMDELTAQDGLILRGQRIVIPLAMRSEMKQKSHVGHLGINSYLRGARDLIFWPGMSAEIRQYVQACATCATYADRQPAEPFIITEIPKRPWQRVAADIFSCGGSVYLVTVDQHSNFF